MGFTDWLQRRMNVRTVAKIRHKGGNFMGVDVPILHSVGQEGTSAGDAGDVVHRR
jgi:hypothetical protein